MVEVSQADRTAKLVQIWLLFTVEVRAENLALFHRGHYSHFVAIRNALDARGVEVQVRFSEVCWSLLNDFSYFQKELTRSSLPCTGS